MKAVAQRTLFVADAAWDEPHNGIGDGGSSQFASREHIVANAEFACDEVLAYALVNAFVMTAKHDEVSFERELVGDVLIEGFSIGAHVNHLVIVALGLQGRDAPVDGLALHHHASAATIGVIVNAAPFVGGIVAQIVQLNVDEPFLLCPRQDGFLEEALHHGGQNGDNIDSHVCKNFVLF